MRIGFLAALVVAGAASAQAGPLPTISAGPPAVNPYAASGLQAPYRGYAGYRLGLDGRFHGYGLYAPRRTAASAPPVEATAARDRAVGYTGDVLAAAIVANHYAPLYGVLNVGYGPYGY